ncbi:hypothetical protein NBRC116188_21970 [Oceaniserpentilla sp. 4NH20-0058]|uniref:TorF family putative porin n=1 Tax=Oceaniserpentilla sp. 4NH20-0058 TaxID=3127660 RepID=UPI0031020013
MSKYIVVLAALCMAAPSFAELTTNLGTSNKYMFRGVKQSDADIVVNGGIDYQGPFGFYTGAWAYTGSIEDLKTSEINAYAGFAYAIGPVALGLGAITYERGGDAVDDSEYNANIAWDAYRYSYYVESEEAHVYQEVAANYDFWDNAGMSFTAGLHTPEDAKERWDWSMSILMGLPSKSDFEIILNNHQRKGYSLSLSFTRQFDW